MRRHETPNSLIQWNVSNEVLSKNFTPEQKRLLLRDLLRQLRKNASLTRQQAAMTLRIIFGIESTDPGLSVSETIKELSNLRIPVSRATLYRIASRIGSGESFWLTKFGDWENGKAQAPSGTMVRIAVSKNISGLIRFSLEQIAPRAG